MDKLWIMLIGFLIAIVIIVTFVFASDEGTTSPLTTTTVTPSLPMQTCVCVCEVECDKVKKHSYQDIEKHQLPASRTAVGSEKRQKSPSKAAAAAGGYNHVKKTNILDMDAYTPFQLTKVYESSKFPLDGKGQKIVIISAFKYDNLQKDFKTFCNRFGYKNSNLTVHNLGTRSDREWSIETCLDTQWARAMAPNAEIIVVHSASDSISDMANAVRFTVEKVKPNIVSMSWGASESSGLINKMESFFQKNPNIVFLAASGDYLETSYPSTSPNVISVGGSILYISEEGKKMGETDWASQNGLGTGYGLSRFFPTPKYQEVSNSSAFRSTPDISCIGASPSGKGVAVCNGDKWIGVHGTSLSCPMFAGMIATVNSKRKTPLTRDLILTHLYGLHITYLDTMSDGVGFINNRTIDFLIEI